MGTVILKIKPSTEPDLSYELRHHGIKDMRWGYRRFQDYDGKLTAEGKKRYAKQVRKARSDAYDSAYNKVYNEERDRLAKAGGKTAAEVDKAASAAAQIAGKAAANNASRNAKFDIDSEVKKDVDAVEGIAKNAGDMTRTANTAVNNMKINVPKMDLSNMTDQEMRNQINRARLEAEYDREFNPDRARVERGRARVSNILNGIGTAISLGTGALGIALLIKQLREG